MKEYERLPNVKSPLIACLSGLRLLQEPRPDKQKKGKAMKESLLSCYERISHLASSKGGGKSLSPKHLIIKSLGQHH